MTPISDTVRAAITAWLSDGTAGAGMTSCPRGRLADEVRQGERRFVEQPGPLRCFGHLDIEDVDVLVADPVLDTLGLVRILEGLDGERIAAAIRQAAYLRHLAGQGGSARIAAPTVELVLAVPADWLEDLRRTLAGLNRDTHLLYGIGLNILPTDDAGIAGPRPEARLARAFAWLLPATRRHFRTGGETADPGAGPGADATDPPPVTLSVDNLRRIRTLSLELTRPMTVVHGRNGTGKSTIAEAIELTLTGRSERAPQAARDDPLDPVPLPLRPLDSPGATPRVVLARGNKTLVWPAAPGDDQRDRPLTPLAFRLDSREMTRLSATDAAQRLEIMDRAFALGADSASRFAGAREALTGALSTAAFIVERLVTDRTTEEVGDELPQDDRDRIECELDRLQGSQDRAAPNDLADLLLSPWRLKDLREVGIGGDIDADDPDALAAALDAALCDLRRLLDAVDRHLGAARDALERVQGWRYRRQPQPEAPVPVDREALVLRLQRLVALHDVISGVAGLAGAAGAMAAAAAQEEPGRADVAGESGTWALEALRRLAALDEEINFRLLANDLEADLLEAQDQAERLEEAAEPDAAARRDRIRPLTRAEQAALDAFGPRLGGGGTAAHAGLGTAIASAMEAPDQRVTFGDVVIGAPGWANLPLQVMKDLEKLHRRAAERPPEDLSPTRRLEALRVLHGALATYRERDRDLSAAFLKGIAPFAEAVNEIVALMTPARWAYDPLRLALSEQGEGMPILLDRGDGPEVPAEAILNTAELNILALALFFLLAPRRPNPARLLVLDDPWHAMDGQSVAAASRALGRLIRLLPHGWRILALVHGNAQAEVMARETAADLHRLSWFKTDLELMPERAAPEIASVVGLMERIALPD